MSVVIDNYPYLDSLGLFARVADEPWAVMLDSGIVHGKPPVTRHADYDVLAIQPLCSLVTRGEQTSLTHPDGEQLSDADPLALVRSELDKLGPIPAIDEAAFMPGAIGYFGYDLARRFERLPSRAIDDEKLPEMAVGIYPAVLVVDHRHRRCQLLSVADHPHGKALRTRWQSLIDAYLKDPPSSQTPVDALVATQISENVDIADYRKKFAQVRRYTIDGDCYQVNLTKRFSAPVTGSSWATYQALRDASPAPYGAYLNLPFVQILSNSPESFIQCHGGKVRTSPIKGTMPRDHADPARDRRIAKRLESSIKDRAENLMIVDLMRNDLGRCCEIGSVKVPSLFALHSFANVHHLISTITGVLRNGLHSLDLLRACFPGGSITGAPKIRAMQIIEELEPHRRGLYCGAIGHVGMDGSLETNIAIRTIVVSGGVARFSAGGGLVIDSDVEQEYQEIIDKARMMTEALSG